VNGGGASPDPHMRRAADGLPLRGRTILVVEDESLIALLIQDVLEEAGASVLGPCYSFAECMRAARFEKFDAAVLDVDLAGEDVFPAADEIRKRGIPFVFHTAHGDREEIRARFGDIAVCRKPVSMDDLLKVLARLAGGGPTN
jgi:CheY-like chemotaxis protein